MDLENNDLHMYINKLVKTIETQSSFSFGNKRLLDKTRIDDILCCIDANFPDVLKKFKKHGQPDKNVKSYKLYDSLIANIKIKPLIGTSSYAINYKEVMDLAKILEQAIQSDASYIAKAYPNLQ